MFADRTEAGKRLAERFEASSQQEVRVLAIPRGGVIVANEVAKKLRAPLDVVIVRKIGHPNNPEYAIGAVTAEGFTLMHGSKADGISPQWLREEIAREQEEAKRRELLYRTKAGPLSLRGKTVLLIDDGIATGFTCSLALSVLHSHEPKRLIVAVPVAPLPLPLAADQCVVLERLESGDSVGMHYRFFPQVSDETVQEFLVGNSERNALS